MATEVSSIDQLKYFLKEMFQFNANDLDFGIYKIYNLKRKEIESFVDGTEEQCLEPTINRTLQDVSNLEKKIEQQALFAFLKESNKEGLLTETTANFEKIQSLIDVLATDDAQKKSLSVALKSSTQQFNITDELKDKIYNHILGFFEMYYSNGDFGYNNRSRSLYKVPYEADYDGNDTMFHWKHKGSLYIKTGNAFNAIKFKLNHLGKEFELRLETNEDSENEEVAQNNNKDSQLKHYKFKRFEDVDGVTRIVFNLSNSSTTKAELFKALFKDVFKSDVELDKYFFVDDKPVFSDLTDDYDKVENGNVKGIGALRVKRSTLLTKINKNFPAGSKVAIVEQDGQERFSDETLETLYNIDKKLNSFYIGNDSDYFIHEDLKGFLAQEKERFIKNYILGDLNSILNGKLDNTTLIVAKAFNDVTDRIIEFLSAIEEFQKKLFTMKKKIVECEYCLTIDNINEKYYPEILANQAQLSEWEDLFSVKTQTIEDLKAQPTLVLDTKFFKQSDGSNAFKDKVLAEIDLLDEKTNGLLVNSENYQVLELLSDKYNKKIKTVFIDPPYNTGGDGFIYKDSFRHSSWSTMMENRLSKLKLLLQQNALFFASIDDNEIFSLKEVCDTVFKRDSFKANFIWNSRKSKQNDIDVSLSHNYILCYSLKNSKHDLLGVPLIEEEFSNHDSHPRGKWKSAPLHAPGIRENTSFFKIKNPNTSVEYSCPNGRHWGFYESDVEDLISNGSIYFGANGNGAPNGRRFWDDVKNDFKTIGTIWDEIHTATQATKELENILGHKNFQTPKPTELTDLIVQQSMLDGDIIIDFFAGSGTTGHSVIKLNQLDKKSRKYILVESGTYFNYITAPRVKKAIYSLNWKGGKPTDNYGSKNHIFKYMVLEQYEDVLDAIEQFDGDTPKNLPLKYLYKPELNQLESSLDLSKPFSNQAKYGQPTKVGFIDLVETYNYLQGYEIKTIKPYNINDKYYKVVETTNGTLVIWRDIALAEDDREAVKTIIGHYPEATHVDINFDFNILATLKDKQLPVGGRVLDLTVIHKQVFSE
jgi:adenine-specific DNA-methyltransferase